MDADGVGQEDFETRLERTVQELQDRLKRQQDELARLRQSTTRPFSITPSSDPRERLLQLRTITAAYEKLTPEKLDLPPPKSIIPSLVATRTVIQSTKLTKAALPSLEDQLHSLSGQVQKEESALSDARLLKTKLQERIIRLRHQQNEQQHQPPQDRARQLADQKGTKIHAFELETRCLQSRLDEFIDEHLAAMVAAEELGGPVVGDLLNIDETMLETGFTASGAPSKTNVSKFTKTAQDKRQRRIDEIWGAQAQLDDSVTSDGEISAKVAAGNELTRLIALLIRGLEGESEDGVYVRLERDSAAARFLVRSKVARFHGKDAGRLRMVDFGRELDE